MSDMEVKAATSTATPSDRFVPLEGIELSSRLRLQVKKNPKAHRYSYILLHEKGPNVEGNVIRRSVRYPYYIWNKVSVISERLTRYVASRVNYASILGGGYTISLNYE